MTLTFSITLSGALVIGFSVFLLIATTGFCLIAGLFDGDDPWGVAWIFTLIIYGICWAMPSLIAWAVWATWFRGGS